LNDLKSAPYFSLIRASSPRLYVENYKDIVMDATIIAAKMVLQESRVRVNQPGPIMNIDVDYVAEEMADELLSGAKLALKAWLLKLQHDEVNK
jgi:hypothetical protein